MKNKHQNGNTSGFTLIEMIVAIGIFTIAMLISTGAILSISAAQKRAAAIQNVQDNIRFALETMAKEARLGYSFHCGSAIDEVLTDPRDCGGGGPSFTFFNARGEVVSYQLRNGQIERWSGPPDNTFFPVTSQNASIDRLDFYVFGSGVGDDVQPRVVITARGSATVKGQSITIDLQTALSQRLLDS
ncbi:MAG: type II secretion system protein [bacterium]|nr:type II secretion system protein [bacterium]